MSHIHHRIYLRDLKIVPAKEEFVIGDQVVKKVDVIGTVIYLSERDNAFIFQLDDLTGIIECIQFKNSSTSKTLNLETELEEDTEHDISNVCRRTCSRTQSELILSLIPPRRSLQLGDLVNIRGHPKIFRNKPQIICNNIRYISDPDEIWFRVNEIEAYQSHLVKSVNKNQ